MDSHERLVQHLLNRGVLRTPAIIDAFRAIDRRDFVTDALAHEAYSDTALPIGLGQTISQPYTVAFMLELLQPRAGQNILDVGFGSGWQTALLAHIVSSGGKKLRLPREASPGARRSGVTALEIIPELCEKGRRNVMKYNYVVHGFVEVHCQSGLRGYSANAPYDRIVAAAAGDIVQPAWLEQTKVGGRIVTPVGSSIMVLARTSVEAWNREEHPGFAFVPLVGS